MNCSTQVCEQQVYAYRRDQMETFKMMQEKKLPSAEIFADGAVEIFADDGTIVVVIHSGRYQISIEIG